MELIRRACVAGYRAVGLADHGGLGSLSRFAQELSGMGSKVNFDWLYSWLIEPTHYAPDTKMPSLRLSPAEAADIATYLLTLKKEEFVQKEFPTDGMARRMADDLMFDVLAAQRSERRSRAIMNDEGSELTNMLLALLRGESPAGLEPRVTSEVLKGLRGSDALPVLTPRFKKLFGQATRWPKGWGPEPRDPSKKLDGNYTLRREFRPRRAKAV
jgi:hypothetical protein